MFVRPIFIFGILIGCLTTLRSYPLDGTYDFYDMEAEHEGALAHIDSATIYFPQSEEYSDFIEKDYGDFAFGTNGNSGSNGYKKYKDFERGSTGQHEAKGDKSFYNDKNGKSSGHNNNKNSYDIKHQAVGAHKGGDYAVSNSFNKGSKTSGYHNVYHKEEYKKNNQFHDEKSKSGHYNRYGDFGATLLAAAGVDERKKIYDEAYRNSNNGKSGYSDTGSLYNHLKNYGAANGYDGYYNRKAYDTNRGSNY